MQVRTFFLTLGIGMAAGAVGAMMLPKRSPVRKAAQQAADTVGDVVCKTVQMMD